MRRAITFTWSAAIDLLLDAVLGTLWFMLIFALLVAGVALIPAFGLGLIPLGLAAWLTRFTGRIELARANALLEAGVAAPVRPLTRQTGWKRPFAQGIKDLRDGQTWRILVHHLSSMVLGTAVVTLGWVVLVTATETALGLRGSWIASWVMDVVPAPLTAVVIVAAVAALLVIVNLAGQLDRVVLASLLGPARNAELRQELESVSGARQAAVDAASIERQRIERDLHDGAQPRLVSVAMTLGMARQKLDTDPEAARALLDQAHADAKLAITDLRQLARGIHPAVLTDRGLDAALSALASRCAVPTRVAVDLPERLAPEIEAVVYFAIAEALTNVSKHSGATACTVTVRCTEDTLLARVTDDGRGGAVIDDDGGLAGIVARVRSAGGTVGVFSPAGGPTELELELPCAS